MSRTALPEAPREFELSLGALSLDEGGRVDPLVVRGWLWSPREDPLPRTIPPPRDPATSGAVRRSREELLSVPVWPTPTLPSFPTVLVVHALTGDMRAGGESGWWAPVIGPGRALDPTEHRIICINQLGSCYGTSGPADEGFPATRITTWDQARAILLALDGLGIGPIELVVGGSLGGLIALCLAALAPDRFKRLMPIAATAKSSSWVIGFDHVQRQIIRSDPGFPEDIGRGLELARQIAILTYRAEEGLDARQGRIRTAGSDFPFRMQTYLEHQGKKLRRRFDGRAYLAQADAMDSHDATLPPIVRDDHESWSLRPGPVSAQRIRSATLAVAIDTDRLFFASRVEALRDALSRATSFDVATIQSPHGHDAFLIEWSQLDPILRQGLALAPPGEPHGN